MKIKVNSLIRKELNNVLIEFETVGEKVYIKEKGGNLIEITQDRLITLTRKIADGVEE